MIFRHFIENVRRLDTPYTGMTINILVTNRKGIYIYKLHCAYMRRYLARTVDT